MQNQRNSILSTILKTPFEGFNRFIVADLREGRLSLEGLSYPVRVLVLSGMVILFISALLTIFFEPIRQQSDLITLQNSNLLLRGSSVASLVIPLTLFLASISIAFILAGAIRSPWWFRFPVFILFYTSILPFLSTAITSLGINPSIRGISLSLSAAFCVFFIPIFMLLRRRREPRLVFEFLIIFLSVSIIVQVSQLNVIDTPSMENRAFSSLTIDAFFSTFILVVMPFFIQIGMEIAKFVRKVAFWTGEIIYFRLAQRSSLIYSALAILTFNQLFNTGRNTLDYFQQTTFASSLRGYLGGAITLLIVALVWFVFNLISGNQSTRIQHDDEIDDATDWLVFPAIFLALNSAFIGLLALLLFPFLTIPSILFEWEQSIDVLIFQIADFFLENDSSIIVIIAIVSTVWGAWLARKKQVLSGCYIALFGLFFMYNNLTRPSEPLEILGWLNSTPIDFWWSLFIFAVLLYWLVRKQLTPQRAISLIILTVANTLIFRQEDFIEEPLYFVLEFSGTGMIAFGIIWDTVTIGNWANEDTPFLPRLSRIFLYLGYVLLALATILWAMGQHDHFMLNQFTGDGALAGVGLLGRPMIYLLYPLLLLLPKDQLPVPEIENLPTASSRTVEYKV